jgi:hypothetical protein
MRGLTSFSLHAPDPLEERWKGDFADNRCLLGSMLGDDRDAWMIFL